MDVAPPTPLVLVTGLHRTRTARAAGSLFSARSGAVLVHHDVRDLGHGIVLRTVLEQGPAGTVEHQEAVELAHGCLSCTLRLDLLPLLRTLARRDDVSRIVLQLDPSLEPEHLCWAIEQIELDDSDGGGRPETAGAWVRVEAVLAVVDAGTWLTDATGDADLTDRGLAATPEDERTVAQVAVGQVTFADAVLMAGSRPDAWTAARLDAVLDRLVPGVPRADARTPPGRLLAAVPPHARRGRTTSPHEPLLPGEPPLREDCGVELVRFGADRPFSPERLHDALDVLLEGVVYSRGRIWLASQHERALWLESAGQGVRVGDAGPWLATLPDDAPEWARVDPQRKVAAALRWDPLHGDRHTEIVVLSHRQPAIAITAALHAALLTDDEWAAGPEAWREFPDPFGAWHEDPCEATGPAPEGTAHITPREERS